MELNHIEEKMNKTISVLQENFSEVRAGRANPAILNKIRVDYYGTPTPINQVAGISVPEARLIVIQPWDISLLKEIEKEIIEEYGDFEMFSTSELTGEMLENRMNGDKVIVERTKGIVLDDELNGSAEDHYISYRSVEGAQLGDEIITYLVYNPATSYIDDIIERYDVIVK